LREKKFSVTAVLADHEVTGLEAGDTTDKMLGIAFDIGTTTVVGYLMDLLTGKELGAVSTMNPRPNLEPMLSQGLPIVVRKRVVWKDCTGPLSRLSTV